MTMELFALWGTSNVICAFETSFVTSPTDTMYAEALGTLTGSLGTSTKGKGGAMSELLDQEP